MKLFLVSLEMHSHLMTWVNVGIRYAALSPNVPTAYVLMRECNCILAVPFSMCIRYCPGVGRCGMVGGSEEDWRQTGQNIIIKVWWISICYMYVTG